MAIQAIVALDTCYLQGGHVHPTHWKQYGIRFIYIDFTHWRVATWLTCPMRLCELPMFV